MTTASRYAVAHLNRTTCYRRKQEQNKNKQTESARERKIRVRNKNTNLSFYPLRAKRHNDPLMSRASISVKVESNVIVTPSSGECVEIVYKQRGSLEKKTGFHHMEYIKK